MHEKMDNIDGFDRHFIVKERLLTAWQITRFLVIAAIAIVPLVIFAVTMAMVSDLENHREG